MGWGIRRQQQASSAAVERRGGESDERRGKGKAAAFSFSPLSWIAKLTARSSQGKAGGAKPAPPPPATAFHSFLTKRTCPSSSVELERLLACYLALNADEHHDCIVKVFRQVWFEYINLHLSRRRRARRC
uniref:Transcription repressor n=1 Tax=Oryza brachyantha TaxID=4533 RepID=J3M8W8_ORYBR